MRSRVSSAALICSALLAWLVPAWGHVGSSLLPEDCGSCHGMRLTGGLGPALTPERFRKWPEEQLAATILYGRPGTPMPPWRPFLTEPEALWLARTLKQGVDRP